MTESTEDTDLATAVVRVFVNQSGKPVEIKRGTISDILGEYQASETAWVVARPGRPRSLDFFVNAANAVGDWTDQGYAIGVGTAGQLAVTMEDGTPVITYAPAAWAEYMRG